MTPRGDWEIIEVGMRLDVAQFRREYEALRDGYVRMRVRFQPPPQELAGALLRDAYGRGFEKGMWNAAEFGAVDEPEPPVEIEGKYEGAWRMGREDGTFSGRLTREIILEKLLRERGLMLKPV